MRRFWAAALLAALLVPGGAAHAARITVGRTPTGGPAVYLSGQIFGPDAARFERATHGLAGRPVTVYLDSEGGDADASLAIGATVRLMKARTVVPQHAICASGCALIWLAGAQRAVDTTSAIGFHSGAVVQHGVRVASPEVNEAVLAYLGALGYSHHTARKLVQAPPDGIFWLTEKSARQLGIHTDVVSRRNRPAFTPGRNVTDPFTIKDAR